MSVPSLLSIFGNSGGEDDPVYVDDVFSAFVYEGNGGTKTINNGIDLSGEGGLTWVKQRDVGRGHNLCDTERGATKILNSSNTGAEGTYSTTITGFTGTGFSVGSDSGVNSSTGTYISWTFRKAPGFLDIVTWTGNSTAGRQIPHALGSVPGMIIVKRTNSSEAWQVYHRSMGATKYLQLNDIGNSGASSTRWNNTAPTSSVFTVGTAAGTNQTGGAYVAYVFAHDDASFGTDGDESIIKCGGYTGNGSAAGQEINLGFEPQFVFISGIEFTYNGTRYGGGWYLLDSTRGIFTGENDPSVQTQETNAEAASSNMKMELTPTGFKIVGNGTHENYSGGKYMYMAIRRPNKPPELATEVFAVTSGNNNNNPTFTSGFPVDLAFWKIYVSGSTDDFM